jgi:hypothetical protein
VRGATTYVNARAAAPAYSRERATGSNGNAPTLGCRTHCDSPSANFYADADYPAGRESARTAVHRRLKR